MTRLEMMEHVWTTYGFEAKETLIFCTMAEDEMTSEQKLKKAYDKLIKRR